MTVGIWVRPRLGVSSCLLGEEPLSVPIALLAHYALGLPWLAEQTYLDRGQVLLEVIEPMRQRRSSPGDSLSRLRKLARARGQELNEA